MLDKISPLFISRSSGISVGDGVISARGIAKHKLKNQILFQLMSLVIFSILVTILISFICSLTEAALIGVPIAHVKHVADEGSRSGKILLGMKEDIGRPISAILIMNTVANVGGAAVVGALSISFFGQSYLALISCLMTIVLLVFGESIPKQIGVAHCRSVSLFMARPLFFLCRLLSPMITALNKTSKLLTKRGTAQQVSPEEVMSLTEIGNREGVIDSLESSVIKNVLLLDRLLVRDILTPRVVVYRLEENTTLEGVAEELHGWQHTRIPLFRKDDPDHVTHYVIQRDICRALLKGSRNQRLSELARPIHVVPELSPVDKLLGLMVSRGEHIAAVVDEHGGFAGIVTLEDIIEEVVGREIIDEYDIVEDMRKHAENLNRKRGKQRRTGR